MIEYEIEKNIVEEMQKNLDKYKVQVIGTWSIPKIEESDKEGVLVIKVSPRNYETPTTPYMTLDCMLSLTIRADIDVEATNYLNASSAIIDVLEKYQKCECSTHLQYASSCFNPTGFKIGQGNTMIDQSNKVFTYTHQFTIYGIVNS